MGTGTKPFAIFMGMVYFGATANTDIHFGISGSAPGSMANAGSGGGQHKAEE